MQLHPPLQDEFTELTDREYGMNTTWKKDTAIAHEVQVAWNNMQAVKHATLARKVPDTPDEKLRKSVNRAESTQIKSSENIAATVLNIVWP